MKYLPFISVVIPAYNEAQYIAQCLSAFKTIRYDKNRFEVIVVDNGSTDATLEIASSFDVIVVNFSEGMTISSVRNKGAAQAKGELLAFLDADCVVEPNWLDNIVGRLSGSAGAVGARAVAPKEGGTWVQRCWGEVMARSSEKPIEVEWLSSSNISIKRTYFEKIGGFNETLETCEDVDLCYRLRKLTTLIYDPAIRPIHLREPRTLLELFKKEVWHGKSQYAGIQSHGFRRDEFLSIFVPIFYLVNAIFFIVSLGFFNWYSISLSFFLSLAMPMLATLRRILRKGSGGRQIMKFYLIDLVYFLGRSTSILFSVLRVRKKKSNL